MKAPLAMLFSACLVLAGCGGSNGSTGSGSSGNTGTGSSSGTSGAGSSGSSGAVGSASLSGFGFQAKSVIEVVDAPTDGGPDFSFVNLVLSSSPASTCQAFQAAVNGDGGAAPGDGGPPAVSITFDGSGTTIAPGAYAVGENDAGANLIDVQVSSTTGIEGFAGTVTLTQVGPSGAAGSFDASCVVSVEGGVCPPDGGRLSGSFIAPYCLVRVPPGL